MTQGTPGPSSRVPRVGRGSPGRSSPSPAGPSCAARRWPRWHCARAGRSARPPASGRCRDPPPRHTSCGDGARGVTRVLEPRDDKTQPPGGSWPSLPCCKDCPHFPSAVLTAAGASPKPPRRGSRRAPSPRHQACPGATAAASPPGAPGGTRAPGTAPRRGPGGASPSSLEGEAGGVAAVAAQGAEGPGDQLHPGVVRVPEVDVFVGDLQLALAVNVQVGAREEEHVEPVWRGG